MLQEIIPPEVKIINNCIYKSYEIKDDKVVVKYIYREREYEAEAKLLVGADGAFSRVRRQACNLYPDSKLYISIQEWFKTDSNLNYYGAIFDSEITDFYSWTIPKEDYLILGSALKPNGKANQKFELLKRKMHKYGFEFDKSLKVNGAYMY